MRIELAYGRQGAVIDVPKENLAGVVRPRWPAVLARPMAAVTRALARPVAGPPLAEVLRDAVRRHVGEAAPGASRAAWRGFRVVIIVSDDTRPCPNHDLLVPILAEVRLARIPADCVTLLVATGLHAPLASGAVAELVGPDLAAAYRVVNHFGHRPATLARVGATAAGTPVVLAREWVEASVRIATGVIEPHLMAGFSGGRKAICPGIAGAETVCAWHSPRFIESARALPGILDGNPEHEEALAVADFAPPHFIVNATVDREANLTGVYAGEMRAAHAAGVEALREHVAVPVDGPCDILVTTNGGWPLDGTFYQCQKGLLTGLPVLRPGGTFVFAAECERGIGQDEFTGLCERYETLDEFHAAITAPGAPVVKDQWALENLAKAARHAEILFWSDRLPRDLQRDLFVRPVETLAEGLAIALEKHGPKARVLVMPHGPYVLPHIEESL